MSTPSAIQQTYERIRSILSEARAGAYRAINAAMVAAYWEIGRVIVDQEQQGQQRAGYGQAPHCGTLQSSQVRIWQGLRSVEPGQDAGLLSYLPDFGRSASRIVLDPLPAAPSGGEARREGVLRGRGCQLPLVAQSPYCAAIRANDDIVNPVAFGIIEILTNGHESIRPRAAPPFAYGDSVQAGRNPRNSVGCNVGTERSTMRRRRRRQDSF